MSIVGRPIRVVVGSKNKAKIAAVESAFKKVFGDVIVKAVKVDPGISAQPMSDDEMVRGSINRAKKAFSVINADFGVGLEGGLVRYSCAVFVKGWVAVYNGQRLGLASTVAMQVPEYIWDKIVSGEVKELEFIMEKLSGIEKIGESIGAFGFFTKNLYDRARAFEDAIICSLAPFISSKYYKSMSTLN